MKFLITGGNGFLARELVYFLKRDGFEVIVTNRKTLDVSDPIKVAEFFNKYSIDYVIHSAVCGGKRAHKENINDLFLNIKMFQNLADHSDKFKLMFNFGSGAEFDRRLDIDAAPESLIWKRNPVDYYGLSKNLITRQILQLNNVINLRLFGCFGPFEENQRLFKAIYKNIQEKNPLRVHQNKLMDYFYSEDVYRVIKFYVKTRQAALPKDLNLCYKDKKTLKDIVFLIKDLTRSSNDVILENKEKIFSYTGNSDNLLSLNINLCGLEEGTSRFLKRIEIDRSHSLHNKLRPKRKGSGLLE